MPRGNGHLIVCELTFRDEFVVRWRIQRAIRHASPTGIEHFLPVKYTASHALAYLICLGYTGYTGVSIITIALFGKLLQAERFVD